MPKNPSLRAKLRDWHKLCKKRRDDDDSSNNFALLATTTGAVRSSADSGTGIFLRGGLEMLVGKELCDLRQ